MKGNLKHGRCQVCGSNNARQTDTELVPHASVEQIILDMAALVGIQIAVHRIRLVECPDCVPGRVVRRRTVELPLEAEYAKGYLRP